MSLRHIGWCCYKFLGDLPWVSEEGAAPRLSAIMGLCCLPYPSAAGVLCSHRSCSLQSGNRYCKAKLPNSSQHRMWQLWVKRQTAPHGNPLKCVTTKGGLLSWVVESPCPGSPLLPVLLSSASWRHIGLWLWAVCKRSYQQPTLCRGISIQRTFLQRCHPADRPLEHRSAASASRSEVFQPRLALTRVPQSVVAVSHLHDLTVLIRFRVISTCFTQQAAEINIPLSPFKCSAAYELKLKPKPTGNPENKGPDHFSWPK